MKKIWLIVIIISLILILIISYFFIYHKKVISNPSIDKLYNKLELNKLISNQTINCPEISPSSANWTYRYYYFNHPDNDDLNLTEKEFYASISEQEFKDEITKYSPFVESVNSCTPNYAIQEVFWGVTSNWQIFSEDDDCILRISQGYDTLDKSRIIGSCILPKNRNFKSISEIHNYFSKNPNKCNFENINKKNCKYHNDNEYNKCIKFLAIYKNDPSICENYREWVGIGAAAKTNFTKGDCYMDYAISKDNPEICLDLNCIMFAPDIMWYDEVQESDNSTYSFEYCMRHNSDEVVGRSIF